ncbi:hypothetical protein BKA58DRAFT_446573 [Alternaria rosae]|uniref:uncharacterized protein n=1 Tax=Alternaria rosae TaxID=1187941 RepID=UPI001E8D49DE|nr:uncharacterized protein BKA58DRAFT_446573 [Alternaria rosae]KAH6882135.1 hypothetical protein BKA58DRAFT_446573 [Alternaria rosae]
MSTTPDIVEQWQPPTESLGRVPLITPGNSDGKPIQGDFRLDRIVIDKLHLGTQVYSCNRHGASECTVTAKIETTRADGELYEGNYNRPCADGDQGKAMLEGEYNSMCELYKVASTFFPKRYAYAQFNVSDPKSYFLLCSFLDMDTSQAPDPEQLCKKLVMLHLSSESPTGQFGFHINTYQGNLPQQTV